MMMTLDGVSLFACHASRMRRAKWVGVMTTDDL